MLKSVCAAIGLSALSLVFAGAGAVCAEPNQQPLLIERVRPSHFVVVANRVLRYLAHGETSFRRREKKKAALLILGSDPLLDAEMDFKAGVVGFIGFAGITNSGSPRYPNISCAPGTVGNLPALPTVATFVTSHKISANGEALMLLSAEFYAQDYNSRMVELMGYPHPKCAQILPRLKSREN